MAKNSEALKYGDDIQMVAFGLCGERYAIDILRVQEIVMMTNITRMPKCPEFIEGVVNLRGHVIPIVDMRKRFSLEPKSYDGNTRIIIVDIGGETVGIIVDEVYQVIQLPKNAISQPSAIIAGISAEYLKGIGRLGDSMMIILDLEKILSLEEKSMIAAV